MAWKTHWQCCFQSLNGTQYAVNICEQDYDGDIVQLTGAAEPFTTQEDESEDIFTPIRSQSGYLRVIDPDGTLLADLIPQNNTERLVQLFHGTYTGTWPDGTFTYAADALEWQGFLQAQAYTQPWDGNANELELPVKSLLGALEDVTIDEEYVLEEKNVAALILAAFSQFGLRNTVDLRYIRVISDATDPVNTLLLPILQWSVFFSEEIINNEGDSYNHMAGMSYSEALSAVMSLYGWQMRENGSDIYLVQYDAIQPYHDGLRMQTISFPNLQSMAEGNRITREQKDVPSADMLTALTFRGADNVAGYVQGGRSAKVSLSFEPLNEQLLSLPLTTEDGSQVYTIDKVVNGTVKVQPHERASSSFETFSYKYYANTSVSTTGVDSTYATCLNRSVVETPIMPPITEDPSFVTGAFPIRFSFNPTDDSSQKFLTNGLMVNIRSLMNYDAAIPSNCESVYSVKSRVSPTYAKGYLNIDMAISCFMETNAGQARKTLQFGTIGFTWRRRYKMFLKLQWGTMYWNGEEWTSSDSIFSVETDGTRIITNKTDDITSDKTDGFFIPVTSSLSGEVTLTIMNYGSYKIIYPNDQTETFRVNSSIISNLKVSYLVPIGVTASNRSENIYRQTILQSGFSEDKEISLSVGTMNNNVESLSFIKDGPTSYIEQLTYRTRYSTTKEQRPELHLLDRMVAQFGQVRRLFTAIAQRGLSLMDTRYTYQSRAYFGVKKQTNWRDDTEEVKFIEVS